MNGTIYQQNARDCLTCGRKAKPACTAAQHQIRTRRLPTYWIKWYRNGRAYRESADTTEHREAKRQLALRTGDSARDLPVTPRVTRFTFKEAAVDLTTEYAVNERRSGDELGRRIRLHLEPFFGNDRRMVTITPALVREFISKRQADTIVARKATRKAVRAADGSLNIVEEPEVRRPVSNGEINRELSTLKRMFNLAVENGKLLHASHIPMLKERNVRSGFFEAAQVVNVMRHLNEAEGRVVEFAYLTGWRIDSEVLPLEWRQVDFEAGEVRLNAHTTKNDDGRVFPMTADLRSLLEQQDEIRQSLARQGVIVPWVFFRMVAEHRGGPKKPRPIRTFVKAFRAACIAAGCPGRIPHDLRRTAVRSLVRAGVPERVAMQLTGHKTRSVFERYNIVSEGDLKDAARRLDLNRSPLVESPPEHAQKPIRLRRKA